MKKYIISLLLLHQVMFASFLIDEDFSKTHKIQDIEKLTKKYINNEGKEDGAWFLFKLSNGGKAMIRWKENGIILELLIKYQSKAQENKERTDLDMRSSTIGFLPITNAKTNFSLAEDTCRKLEKELNLLQGFKIEHEVKKLTKEQTPYISEMKLEAYIIVTDNAVKVINQYVKSAAKDTTITIDSN